MGDEIIWSYLAGIWEGEGSAGIYNSKGRPNGRLSVRISQANRPFLEWIRGFLGYGSIITDKRESLVPPKKSKVFAWSATDRCADHFLCGIEPYLRMRKAQIIPLLTR